MLGETLRPEPTLRRAADALSVYTDALAAAHAPLMKRAHHIAGGLARDDAILRADTAKSMMLAGGDRRTWGPAYNKDLAALAPRETPERVAERTARMMTRAAKKDTLSKVVDNSDVGKHRMGST